MSPRNAIEDLNFDEEVSKVEESAQYKHYVLRELGKLISEAKEAKPPPRADREE